MRQRRRWGALGVLMAALALLAPSSANAYVYWTTGSSIMVGRANLDGTSPNPALAGPFSGIADVVSDGEHLYVARSATGLISRVDLDGSNPNPNFVTAVNATGMAANSTHLFYVNGSAIGRVALDGTGKTNILTGLGAVDDVAVDETHVYWSRSDTDTIGIANVNGTAPNPNLITGLNNPLGVAVDGSHIYWTNSGTGSIGRANLDGSQANPIFITGASTPDAIAVDGAHIYWVNAGGDEANAPFGRANIDGTSPNQNFFTGPSGGDGLTVDPFPEATTTSLSCAPSPVTLPASTLCTASVASPTASVAGQAVSFASAQGGAFGAPGSCTLTATGPASGTCQLAYTPSAFGPQALTASFAADLKHSASSGTAALSALAPNDFSLGKVELNRDRGTAKVPVTVVGAGKVAVAGKRLRPKSTTTSEAETVKLKLVGSPKTKKKLRRNGKARVSAKVTFAPTGGEENELPLSLKLRRN